MMILSFMINHLFTYRLSFVSLHSLAKYDMIVGAVNDLVKINIDKVKLSKCLAQNRQRCMFLYVLFSQSLVFTMMSICCQFIFFVVLTSASGEFTGFLDEFH